MAFDSDVALFGTGLAPLLAASYLLSQGKSVLVLNPDWDFFLEDSELPLNPFLQKTPTPQSLLANSPEKALQELRPNFPGAIESWSSPRTQQKPPSRGFHDPQAPHVRQRGRLWISSPDKDRLWTWEKLEDLYVEAADAGLHPQTLDGLLATRWFPGFSGHSGNLRALYLPKLYDVDTVRYRNGLLEFIRERLSPEKRVICAVNEVETMPEGIRFRAGGVSHNARLAHGMLVFWTPRMTSWISNLAKKSGTQLKLPNGIRIWEQWLLNSRDSLDPETVGMFSDLAVWADFEGTPEADIHRLAVLRAGPLTPMQEMNLPFGGLGWASSESMGALFSLCQGFLKWDRFSVRSLRARAILEWPELNPGIDFFLSKNQPLIQIIPGCDGPIVDIIRNVRTACELEQP